MLAQQLASEDDKARFYREARAAAQLNHLGIASIHEIDEDDGRSFIVMEYIEGETLGERLERGLLSIQDTAAIGSEIAEALSAAHKKGIVHRDVKPANIMIVESGHVKILDFGLAKDLEGTVLTKSHSALGTAPYMSPEQLRGDKVDWRTDAWALGVVLYEMLTGKRPFEGAYEAAVAYQIQNEDPADPSQAREEIPGVLSGLVLSLLRKDPNDRSHSLEDVADSLNRFLFASRTGASMISGATTVRSARKRAQWVVAAVTACVIALGAIWAITGSGKTDEFLRPDVIAILPFDVQGDASLDYMRESVVHMLSLKIDGVADLNIIDPNTLLGHVERAGYQIYDTITGREVADRFKAASFILGNIRRIGGLIQIDASLYDENDEVQSTTLVELKVDTLLSQGVDDLAKELLSMRYPEAAASFNRLAISTSSNWEALKDLLDGQAEMRRDPVSTVADSLFNSAIEKDSTFGLAWYRAGTAWATGQSKYRSQATYAHEQALKYLSGRHEKERQQTLGSLSLDTGDASTAERIFKHLTERYPYNAFSWFELAETYQHYNAYRGRMASEAVPYFERADQLDPGNMEIMAHLIDNAVEDGRWAYLDSMIVSTSQYPYRRRLSSLASKDAGVRETAINEIDVSGDLSLIRAANRAVELLEDFYLAERMLRLALEHPRDSEERIGAYQLLAFVLAAQGRISESHEAWDQTASLDETMGLNRIHTILPIHPLSNEWLEELRQEIVLAKGRTRGVTPGSWTRANDERWAREKPFSLGLVGWFGKNSEQIEEAIAELDALVAVDPADSIAYSFARRLDALAAFDSGEYERTLRLQDDARIMLPGWAIVDYLTGWIIDIFVRAEALYNVGRLEEALAWLNSLGDGHSGGGVNMWSMQRLVGPSYQLRAMIYDELGETDQAIEFYSKFVDLWKNADEELQPMVREARERLDALLIASGREPSSIPVPEAVE